MSAEPRHDLRDIVSCFQLDGQYLGATRLRRGHIHDTYVSRFSDGRGEVRYVHQWINLFVFKDPDRLMENIERVTRHAREQIVASGGDPRRQTLTLVPTRDGRSFLRTPDGECWRTYLFIEGAHTYDEPEELRYLVSAGRAFGNFQRMLSTLPARRLHETIPNFHHTRKRFEALVQAVEQDPMNRAIQVKPEIEFALRREAHTSVIVDLLAQGKIPERVTHNDTKLNNVMIDDVTGEGICVIDLDTVMPGSALYDFGDSVRVGASTAAEDEPNLDRVGLDLTMFEHLACGYLDTAREFLTPTEVDHLAFSALLMTLECGMRFLTDYLEGDRYFRISRESHNLDRCRTQFKMVAEMERQLDRMNAIVQKCR